MTITPIDHRLLSICPTRTLLGFAKRRARGRAARLMCISFSSSQGTDPTAVSATSKPMTQTLWKVSIYGKSKHWSLGYYSHWGKHAIDALRTIHFLLEEKLS
jgi:hypothetical protein